jgi:hypothetical protein
MTKAILKFSFSILPLAVSTQSLNGIKEPTWIPNWFSGDLGNHPFRFSEPVGVWPTIQPRNNRRPDDFERTGGCMCWFGDNEKPPIDFMAYSDLPPVYSIRGNILTSQARFMGTIINISSPANGSSSDSQAAMQNRNRSTSKARRRNNEHYFFCTFLPPNISLPRLLPSILLPWKH